MLNFIEPKPFDPLIKAVQAVWTYYARLTSSHLRLEISEQDRLRLKQLKGQRALICPNHADHHDPMVLFGLSAVCEEHFAYLTAREMFKQYPSPAAVWLQLLGAYSVVRAAADIESYKMSLELLLKNKAKIVIFPEGEITNQNMRLAPLENGPEQLAISAAMKKLSEEKQKPVWIIPVGILYRFEKAIKSELETVLSSIENELNPQIPTCRCVPHRIRECFMKLLSLTAEQNMYSQQTGDSFDALKELVVSHTVKHVAEEKKFKLASYEPSIENIHKLRNWLNEERFKKGATKITLRDRALYRSLKSATNFFAIDELSFAQSLTQEQAYELLFVLEEEVFRRNSIQLDRICHLSIAKPINVNEFIADFKKSRESTVEQCKILLAHRIKTSVTTLATMYPSEALFPICQQPD